MNVHPRREGRRILFGPWVPWPRAPGFSQFCLCCYSVLLPEVHFSTLPRVTSSYFANQTDRGRGVVDAHRVNIPSLLTVPVFFLFILPLASVLLTALM